MKTKNQKNIHKDCRERQEISDAMFDDAIQMILVCDILMKDKDPRFKKTWQRMVNFALDMSGEMVDQNP